MHAFPLCDIIISAIEKPKYIGHKTYIICSTPLEDLAVYCSSCITEKLYTALLKQSCYMLCLCGLLLTKVRYELEGVDVDVGCVWRSFKICHPDLSSGTSLDSSLQDGGQVGVTLAATASNVYWVLKTQWLISRLLSSSRSEPESLVSLSVLLFPQTWPLVKTHSPSLISFGLKWAMSYLLSPEIHHNIYILWGWWLQHPSKKKNKE